VVLIVLDLSRSELLDSQKFWKVRDDLLAQKYLEKYPEENTPSDPPSPAAPSTSVCLMLSDKFTFQ
jgi:hypothetical protein